MESFGTVLEKSDISTLSGDVVHKDSTTYTLFGRQCFPILPSVSGV